MSFFMKVNFYIRIFSVVYYILFFVVTIYGQAFLPYHHINVLNNNNQRLAYPFSGGINNVQFGKVDANRDGIKDVIVYNKANKNYLVFLAKNNHSTDFELNNNYAMHFPPISGWMILKDYNCDGIEDVFTYNGLGSLKVYKGTYRNDTILYLLQQDGCYYQGVSTKINVYCSEVIKPAIVDVNQDGDLDIISFNVNGNRLNYYENQQKENTLSCDSLFFSKADNCWGNIEDTLSSIYALRDTCSSKFNRLLGTEQIQHTGSILEAMDIDNNNAIDLIIGSISLNNLTLLYNDGTKNYASFLRQDYLFPSNNIPVDIYSFASPSFIDVDNDNQIDLLVSTFDNDASNVDNCWYYKNIGNHQFQLQQKNFLLDNMIDLGENSYPCFADINQDGLIDILIGSNGKRNHSNTTTTALAYYKNIGTTTLPKYQLEEEDFLNISTYGVSSIAPNVGDIDNDNDNDILIGLSNGKIMYWENTSNNPTYEYKGYLKDASNNDIHIGNNATPHLIDIDKNGTTDLLIGERNGNINLYINPLASGFELNFSTDSVGKIAIKTNGLNIGYTHPTCIDINQDGKLDLIIGTNTQGIIFYDNIEDSIYTHKTASSINLTPFLDQRATLSIADITNDGNLELVSGNISGGICMYSQLPPIISKIITPTNFEFSIYPNPAKTEIFIQQNELHQNFKLQLFNSFGQMWIQKNYSGIHHLSFDIQQIPNGIYYIKLLDEKKMGIQKIIIQH